MLLQGCCYWHHRGHLQRHSLPCKWLGTSRDQVPAGHSEKRPCCPHQRLGPGTVQLVLLKSTQSVTVLLGGKHLRHRRSYTASEHLMEHMLQESRLQRSFLQENMTAIAASLDGTYVAAGGSSGSIYLWTAADGCLVAVWPAHFKVRTAHILQLCTPHQVTCRLRIHAAGPACWS